DLDAVIPAIGDEEAALRVERERVRRAELSGPRAHLAPLFDVLAVLVELHDSPIRVRRWIRILAAVAVGDEDVAVWRRDHIARLVERIGTIAWHARLSERQQHLALRTELDHLMALRAFFVALAVGDPDVSVLVDVKAVRKENHAAAKAREHFAGRAIELEDRRERRIGARIRAAAVVRP